MLIAIWNICVWARDSYIFLLFFRTGSRNTVEERWTKSEFYFLSFSCNFIGGFIKEEYCSWVQYKSGPGGGAVDVKRVLLTI